MTSTEREREIVGTLDAWSGSPVSVRVTVGDPGQLVAVFSGLLQRRSDEKRPALFWPVEQAEPPPAERPGIYLHPDAFEGGRVHPGDFVLELRQGPVTTNIRRLETDATAARPT